MLFISIAQNMTGWSKCVEIWAVSKLLLRKYLAPGYLLSRNRRRKRGYSSHPTTNYHLKSPSIALSWIHNCLFSQDKHSQAQQQVCVDEGLRLTKQEIQGNGILALEICINSLDLTHLLDKYRKFYLGSGESWWVNRLKTNLWSNCNQSTVPLMVRS